MFTGRDPFLFVSPSTEMRLAKLLLSTLTVFDDEACRLRRKVIVLYGGLIVANALAWAWALAAFHNQPLLLATGLIAYGFGLRHAVDADHIAAIDNVARKLMQEGKRPITVGFFFALGHSTVVLAASIVIALTAVGLHQRFPELIEVGGVLDTSVSALFLFAVAMINIVVLGSVFRLLGRVRRGEDYAEHQLREILAQRGMLSRLFRAMFRVISRSWHMYPFGFLFGLGFDTATEIGLLGISAAEASKGLSIWSILVFPALFCRRHVARRHQRWDIDGRSVWLGSYQPGPQAILQPDDYRLFGDYRGRGCRDRGGRVVCGAIGDRQRVRRFRYSTPRCGRVLGDWHLRGELARLLHRRSSDRFVQNRLGVS
jgi:high-affinity nickel permease